MAVDVRNLLIRIAVALVAMPALLWVALDGGWPLVLFAATLVPLT